MVMRPFRNIPITKQKSGFSFSRNVSTNTYTHQFFNPSYISPKDLIKVDEIGFNGNNSSSKNCNKSIFKYVAPALSVTKNYVIFDSHDQINDRNHNLVYPNNHFEDDKILLRKLNHKGNKNGRLNISVDSINQSYTVLNIRRANSNNVKQISIPHKSIISKRDYTTDNLEKDLSNLKIEEIKEEAKVEPLVEEIQHIEHVDPIKPANRVKFQQLNDQNNYKFKSVDDALDSFLYNDPVKSQEIIIDSMISLGKFNEVLPVFNRMRNNEIIPSIDIYNKVLKSIQLRETDESLEIRLTHLLNTYSDMLSNNLKPNHTTYELIIDNLVKGSIKSYQLSNFKNGYEFFKIAFELFLINHNESTCTSTFKNNSLYINLLTCLNYFKMKDVTQPQKLFNLIHDKISASNKIDFYLQMIKFATLFKDVKFVEDIYNNHVKIQLSNKQLLTKHDIIYQEMIQSYNLCNDFQKSSLMLDSLINNIPKKESKESQKLISQYLSTFIKSQSLINPTMAFKMLHKFSNTNWLPSVDIESLITLSFSFLRSNDLTMSLKIWDFLIIRSDFDLEYNNLLTGKKSNEYSIYISNFHNQLILAVLNSGDKNLILKSVREVLCKNSLIIDDSLLVNLIRYLNLIDAKGTNGLIVKLILNQGYKRIVKNSSSLSTSSKLSLNNYLSLIIDFISIKDMVTLFNSKFFKRVVEEYRLLKDNVYGILKIYQAMMNKDVTESNETINANLKYYSKVLDYEFNDVDNCYVQIPPEIANFKTKLQELI